MNVDKVIEAYRNADEEEQICLFLAYRDLREIFNAIDLGSESGCTGGTPWNTLGRT